MSLNNVRDLMRAIGDVSDTRSQEVSEATKPCKIANIDPNYVGPPNTTLPSVIFEGESDLSQKTYQIINPSYSPQPNDRVIMMPVGSTYVIVGPISIGLDSGYLTSGGQVVVNSPHTISSYKIRSVGPLASLYLAITLGATITAPADGNIVNTTIAHTVAPFLPNPNSVQQPLTSLGAGPAFTAYIDAAGLITLTATSAGVSLAIGATISIGGMYML